MEIRSIKTIAIFGKSNKNCNDVIQFWHNMDIENVEQRIILGMGTNGGMLQYYNVYHREKIAIKYPMWSGTIDVTLQKNALLITEFDVIFFT